MPHGSMWSKMDYGGVIWRAQLHVYISEYILIVFDSKLIVFTLTDMM